MLPLSRSLFDHEAMSLLTVSVAAALLTATIVVAGGADERLNAARRPQTAQTEPSIAFFSPSRS